MRLWLEAAMVALLEVQKIGSRFKEILFRIVWNLNPGVVGMICGAQNLYYNGLKSIYNCGKSTATW